jgi:hypothetical protein
MLSLHSPHASPWWSRDESVETTTLPTIITRRPGGCGGVPINAHAQRRFLATRSTSVGVVLTFIQAHIHVLAAATARPGAMSSTLITGMQSEQQHASWELYARKRHTCCGCPLREDPDSEDPDGPVDGALNPPPADRGLSREVERGGEREREGERERGGGVEG